MMAEMTGAAPALPDRQSDVLLLDHTSDGAREEFRNPGLSLDRRTLFL
jgi:hypothetical protein